jgi:hypothetical protein
MPKNISIYVNSRDADIWNEAARFIRFHENKSLSAYLTDHLRKYLEQYDPNLAKKD